MPGQFVPTLSLAKPDPVVGRGATLTRLFFFLPNDDQTDGDSDKLFKRLWEQDEFMDQQCLEVGLVRWTCSKQ